MRQGEHTIGRRRHTTRVDGNGDPVLGPTGRPITDTSDLEVEGCLVVPATRRAGTNEPRDRSAPRVMGNDLYAPDGTDLTADDLVVWPITSRTDNGDGTVTLDGPTWQVDGDVGVWEECVEAHLVKST